ncbi:MAG: PEP-utilizing enzyme [Candidatus ainarchaeum sp.]|nr:PEP-utilizing enzyme [Candidatus ainarchaeum sp.]
MIDPNKELFKWGPIDGRPIYLDYFMQNFPYFADKFPPGWSDTLLHIKEDRTIAVLDYQNLRNNGEVLFNTFILDEKELNYWHTYWLKIIDHFLEIVKKIDFMELETLSEEELKSTFFLFHEVYNLFWLYGLLPEVANWGGEQLLKREILKVEKENFLKIFERLSAPENISFFQKEEYELFKLKLIEDKKEYENRLKEHQKKYFWLKNSYEDAHFLEIDFFIERLNNISNEKAKETVKLIELFPEKTKEEKNKIIEEFKLPKELLKIGKGLGFCIWWQDLRKKYIFIANHYIKLFLIEFGRRYSLSFKELCYYTGPEIIELINNKKKIDAKKRFSGFAWYFHERGKIDYYEGEDADILLKPYLETKINNNQNLIKGLPVSRGNVIGTIRILYTPKDLDIMQEGEILVAPMTSPDFIVAMRKAIGIITDEGGITCHAAIVSRELGIPCIVGTKIATKLLKNGDRVELDTEKGIIRILNRF